MVKIHYYRGKWSPVFVCDHCGLTIEVAQDGMEISPPVEDVNKQQLIDCYHVHKGKCDQRLSAKLEGETGALTGSNELTTHILQLMYNVKLTPKLLAKFDETPKEAGEY